MSVQLNTLQVVVDPNPFDPVQGYRIEVSGGTPPYTFDPLPSPPNPPGVTVTPHGPNAALVTVPPHTPTGTQVRVRVSDSSTPPQTAHGNSTIG